MNLAQQAKEADRPRQRQRVRLRAHRHRLQWLPTSQDYLREQRRVSRAAPIHSLAACLPFTLLFPVFFRCSSTQLSSARFEASRFERGLAVNHWPATPRRQIPASIHSAAAHREATARPTAIPDPQSRFHRRDTDRDRDRPATRKRRFYRETNTRGEAERDAAQLSSAP